MYVHTAIASFLWLDCKQQAGKIEASSRGDDDDGGGGGGEILNVYIMDRGSKRETDRRTITKARPEL